ncbi:hypothetical protein [Nocardia inohanensis]|uniref:hypothetical protein n=1 Tax=Nocardia inohanensis TaxID=209246 RepID=UPI000A4F8F95|nr:hypothetical protein [Nocardia inohanensis]
MKEPVSQAVSAVGGLLAGCGLVAVAQIAVTMALDEIASRWAELPAADRGSKRLRVVS